MSVIKPKPYRDRQKRTEYPKKENLRDEICRDIDGVLQSARPNSFEEFIQDLEKSGYEIKRGKQIAVKGKQQKRFIRLSSLREGYTEADLRAYLKSEGTRKRLPAKPKEHSRPDRPFNLIIDIQTKLQSKGAGYPSVQRRRLSPVGNGLQSEADVEDASLPQGSSDRELGSAGDDGSYQDGKTKRDSLADADSRKAAHGNLGSANAYHQLFQNQICI